MAAAEPELTDRHGMTAVGDVTGAGVAVAPAELERNGLVRLAEHVDLSMDGRRSADRRPVL
jgi:hypothetical protein